MGWIFLVLVCAGILFLYFFATAAHPDRSWLGDYLYAHRGLHTDEYPENSISAFRNAIEHGYAIELDVHLSMDGVLMVFHDDDLVRMTGMPGRIEDYTLDDLKKMRLGNSNEAIPTFDETLEFVDGKTPILVELKNTGRAGRLEVEVYKRLCKYEGRFAVQSFSPFSMRWFYKNAPGILRGQLSATFYEGAEKIPRWQRWALRHLITNVMCRPNFINYEQHGVMRHVIRRLKKKGVPIFAWTVRTEQEEERVQPYVDAVVFEHIDPNGGVKNA